MAVTWHSRAAGAYRGKPVTRPHDTLTRAHELRRLPACSAIRSRRIASATNADTIPVTGASGHIGRRVAQLLAERGHPTRLPVRKHPERAPRLPRSETASDDYRDRATLERAFAGVRAALVVSVYGPPGERTAMHRTRSRLRRAPASGT